MASGSRKREAGGGAGLPPASVLKATEKAARAAALIQMRCGHCHGKAVRDVLGSTVDSGVVYKLADLRYDLKLGRLELLPPGASVGPVPAGSVRKDAPCASQPLPPASVEEFFHFLQCQLSFQVREHVGAELQLVDRAAKAMWPDFLTFVTPNMGATERWVPYHTVLGVHELFLVQSVHHRAAWDEKQRFLAMFVFRAHCKRDLFAQAQLPLMLSKAFWKDPIKAFEPGGPMERAILEYRRSTGKPLLTSCFRIIPERVLQDNTENLVRSITDRTQKLLAVAERAFAVVKAKTQSAAEKMQAISGLVQDAPGLGETWAKMLTVCIDLAYPKEQLLESRCDVGTGAAQPLRCLLPKGGPADRREALGALLKTVNGSRSAASRNFWSLLEQVEQLTRSKFKALPLVRAQACTKKHCMSAVTLQVQLCEYRQFRHSLARSKYGLPDDETMRGEARRDPRMHPEDYLEFHTKRKCVGFELPGNKKISFEVPVKPVKSIKVAERVACLCFAKLHEGLSKQDVQAFHDNLVKDYRGGEDVPPDSRAWQACKIRLGHANPLVSFHCEAGDGSKTAFQTTEQAAGGALEAERIARLCWERLRSGARKDAVLAFRDELYRKTNPAGVKRAAGRAEAGAPPPKRQRAR